MSRIASLSIRTILGLVTAVMSLLIVTLSVAALVDGIERNSNAHRVAALTSTSRVMFKTLLATRLERGTQIGGLAAEAPSDTAAETRVADNRRISEDGYAEAVAALGGVTLPELPPVLAQLKSAHDAFATLRPKIDAAMRQAKPARDTEVVRDFPRIALAYLDAITATVGQARSLGGAQLCGIGCTADRDRRGVRPALGPGRTRGRSGRSRPSGISLDDGE